MRMQQRAAAVRAGGAAAPLSSLDAQERFQTVFDLHFDAVHRYLHRRAGADVADDLAAETFAVAFARRAAFHDRGSGALPWLLGIATNLLRRYRRTEERRLRAYARTGIDVWTQLDDDDAARIDARTHGARLAGALLALRRQDRETFLLCTLGELTYSEAADALALPVGTVATRMRRARETLAAELVDLAAERNPDA